MPKRLKKDALFQRVILQIKFIDGHVFYTKNEQAILRRWMKKIGVEKLYNLFQNIHDQRGRASFEGSDLQQLFWKLET